MNSFTQKKTYRNFRTDTIYFPFEARKETHEQHKNKIDIDEFRSGTTNIAQKLSNHRRIAEHFPGTVTDFTACSLPPPFAFTFDLLPKSDDVVLFYFIYLHLSKSHLRMSKSLFIYLPLLQTTVYVPHPRTEVLWRHFIKKDVSGRIYASITPHL